MQNAHLLVNFDLPWNPNRIEQRFGRVHRIGQHEVCHMWSMVAKDTREGDVYRRLLEKLEEQRKALGGRVYDVLGQLFDGTSLRDLMMTAIEYGADPARQQELFAIIDDTVGKGLAELIARDSLVSSTLDAAEVQQIRREMERAEAARVQPHHVELLFRRAFESLGGRVTSRDGGYEIRNVPAPILERDRVIGRGKAIVKAYSRITFDPQHVRLEGQTIEAELIYPGHPLMSAVMDLVTERCREAMTTGAILTDPSDVSLAPYLVALLEHDIHDGSGTVVSNSPAWRGTPGLTATGSRGMWRAAAPRGRRPAGRGGRMYARSTTMRGDTGRVDEGLALVKQEIIPAVQAMDGCIGVSLLTDRNAGTSIFTSAWNSEEAMRASARAVEPLRQRGAELLSAAPKVREWEIAVLHRRRPPPRGPARTSRGRAGTRRTPTRGCRGSATR